MKSFSAIAVVVIGSSVCCGAGLPRSTPEAQGVSSSAVLAFVEAADKSVDSLHSFMLVRHGHVVAEGWWLPYGAESPHSLYSLSKSFTSTAVGLAVAEGKLSLDDEVLKFFPEDAPSQPSKNLKEMRVSDLLGMSAGQQSEPPRKQDEPWTKTFLSLPVPFKPGTKDAAATLVVRADGAEQRIACGRGIWRKGRAAWGGLPLQPVAASGAWTEDGVFTAKLCFYETSFTVTLKLKFSGKELQCRSESNVGFGSAKGLTLVGKAK